MLTLSTRPQRLPETCGADARSSQGKSDPSRLPPSVEEHYKFQDPPFARHLSVSVQFSMFGRALRRQPRVGSPRPQEKCRDRLGVRLLYERNL